MLNIFVRKTESVCMHTIKTKVCVCKWVFEYMCIKRVCTYVCKLIYSLYISRHKYMYVCVNMYYTHQHSSDGAQSSRKGVTRCLSKLSRRFYLCYTYSCVRQRAGAYTR